MSLYTFATANFTTPDDLQRRPAMSRSQLFRTIGFLVVVCLAWFLIEHRSQAGGDQFHKGPQVRAPVTDAIDPPETTPAS